MHSCAYKPTMAASRQTGRKRPLAGSALFERAILRSLLNAAQRPTTTTNSPSMSANASHNLWQKVGDVAPESVHGLHQIYEIFAVWVDIETRRAGSPRRTRSSVCNEEGGDNSGQIAQEKE